MIGDLVYGQIPTLNTDVRVFPGSRKYLADPVLESRQQGWMPESIGQDAGRSNMKGPLPGRYYGPGWLAPHSGIATVADSQFVPQTNGRVAPTVRHVGELGPITLTSPMPSVLLPRPDQVTPPDVSPCVGRWVADHPLLATGVAVGLFLLLRGSNGR